MWLRDYEMPIGTQNKLAGAIFLVGKGWLVQWTVINSPASREYLEPLLLNVIWSLKMLIKDKDLFSQPGMEGNPDLKGYAAAAIALWLSLREIVRTEQ